MEPQTSKAYGLTSINFLMTSSYTLSPAFTTFDRFEFGTFGVKQAQKLCKMGCWLVKWVVLLVKWVVHVKRDGFGNFQPLFIIFLSFSMSNGPISYLCGTNVLIMYYKCPDYVLRWS